MPLIDLSAPIRPDPPELPDVLRTDVVVRRSRRGRRRDRGDVRRGPELLRDGEGWATDTFTRLGTHNSTHVDAPWHYNSTIDGRRARDHRRAAARVVPRARAS